MVLTKADLQQIKETLNIEDILLKFKVSINSNINTKIEELDLTISKKIEKLNTGFAREIRFNRGGISAVKLSHNDLVITINESNKKFDADLLNLHESNIALCGKDEELSDEIVQCNDKIKQLEYKISNIEKLVSQNLQHDRKWNLEIDGIPGIIGDDVKQLELAVIKLFNSLNVECSSSDIESIHRLPSKSANKATIVLFESRKMRKLFQYF